ncbi:MAG: Clp protease N-terminal domain-containing protein [Pseudanabaena sp. ELA645]
MFERFTEKAIKVIMLAQEESRRLGHNFVGTEQILLGLIGEGTGVAAKALKSMGVNLRDARLEVEKIIGRGNGELSVEIPFTPNAKSVLELSLKECRELQDSGIGTEHLLLGIIQVGESVAVRVLENLGVNSSSVRRHVIRLLGEVETDYVVAVEVKPDISKKSNENILDKSFFRHFTKKVIQCLLLSSQEAFNLKQKNVSLEILFIGLLKEKTSIPTQVLHSMGINLENTVNLITRRLNSITLFPEELNLLEVLQGSINLLNSELRKLVIDRENAITRQNFDMASQLQERENDIKKRISSLKARIAPDTWEIFEHIFVKEAWEIKFSDESVKALKLAVEESQRLKHNHVSSEHLLLGLLDTGGIEFVDFLEELGTHVGTLRKRLDNVLRGEASVNKYANRMSIFTLSNKLL